MSTFMYCTMIHFLVKKKRMCSLLCWGIMIAFLSHVVDCTSDGKFVFKLGKVVLADYIHNTYLNWFLTRHIYQTHHHHFSTLSTAPLVGNCTVYDKNITTICCATHSLEILWFKARGLSWTEDNSLLTLVCTKAYILSDAQSDILV